jgi:Mg2+-importing ATPase
VRLTMAKVPSAVLPKNLLTADRRAKAGLRVSPIVLESAAMDAAGVCARLGTRPDGLTSDEAALRLGEHGSNVLARDHRPGLPKLLWRAALNPLVVLLAALATVSFATGDARAGGMMVLMILLSVTLKLIQEAKADSAAAKLKALISVAATVLRDGSPREIAIARLVPGDVIHLGAGDMIPGDVRIIQAKDLFVSQGALTGESFPVEKYQAEKLAATSEPLELTSMAFLGTSVESGSATAVVVATGRDTYLGGMAESMAAPAIPTAFDRGISRFTWLMLRFMAVMVPLVFLINGLTKGSWGQAFFFAVAVAVGLTPEMLPMIVTVCLSKGAVAMSRKKVIVKRLSAIQNLGAMDVLCTDKTGTLTMDRVVLERYCDVALHEDEGVLALAYVNSHFQTGLKNVLDRAILAHEETHAHARVPETTKVDEIPFDFQRRIMSVVVRTPEGKDRLISKGAPEAIFPKCARFELDGQLFPMDHLLIEDLKQEHERLSADGFRVLAVASKDVEPRGVDSSSGSAYGKADERDLTLYGYVAFLDPPKPTCAAAIDALEAHGVSVKVVTGDNDLVARKVCKEVGLPTDFVLLGRDVETLDDDELAEAAERVTLFARVSPAHKERIIRALQSRAHTVGFLGDGINDAPALHAADVSVSVDTAVDIAKESADMILLEKSLLVLADGVREGRKVFANILKYVRMGASSNFGNMFSVLGASVFVPYLPMLPIQILANNLLYDVSQTSIPTDAVDPEQVARPRPWDIRQLTRFIAFIGPCSSLFDYTTYFVMLYLFNCWNTSTPAAAASSASLFQTGWFVESLLTQTLVIHVIRTNRIPFLQSRASWPVLAMGVLTVAIGVGLTFSPLGRYLGFRALPPLYWPLLLATLFCYLLLTQGVKMLLLRRKWI